MKLTAKIAGKLKILGLKYTLSSVAVTSSVDEYGIVELSTHQEAALSTVGVTGMQPLLVKGSRLNSTKQERAGVVYGVDKRLEPVILPALPLLEASTPLFSKKVVCGHSSVNSIFFTLIDFHSLLIMCSLFHILQLYLMDVFIKIFPLSF